MTENHPITPPPELVKQWVSLACEYEGDETWIDLATEAARWGADQQLEQCEKYWMTHGISPEGVVAMRYALRPKPPSLKAQALALVGSNKSYLEDAEMDTIRRALESLPE